MESDIFPSPSNTNAPPYDLAEFDLKVEPITLRMASLLPLLIAPPLPP